MSSLTFTPKSLNTPQVDPFYLCFKNVARAMQGKRGLAAALKAVCIAKSEVQHA